MASSSSSVSVSVSTLMMDTSVLLEESSSEDDGDELLKEYAGHSVFRRGKQSKKTSTNATNATAATEMPSLTQSTEGTEESELAPAEAAVEVDPKTTLSLTPDKIEAKAQAIVRDLKLHTVRQLDNLDMVGWYRTTKVLGKTASRTTTHRDKDNKKLLHWYYPCCKMGNDETHVMFSSTNQRTTTTTTTTTTTKKKIGIQYLGWFWSNASSCALVGDTTFVPLLGDGEKKDEEDRLQLFLDQQFKDASVDATVAVHRRTEELVLRASWACVRDNQAAKAHRVAADPDPEDEILTMAVDTRSLSQPTRDDDSSDIEDGSGKDVEGPGGSRASSGMLSPDVKQKRIALRPGDRIRYYDPIGVAGKTEWLRTTEIVGVDPQNKHFPLNLSDGGHLQRDHHIRRIAKVHRGNLVPDEDSAGYRPVSDFTLRTSGTKEQVGFRRKVAQVQQSRATHAKSMDDFWQADDNPADTANVIQTEQGVEQTSDSTRQATPGLAAAKKAHKKKDPAWKIQLTKLLNDTEEKMAKQRRYSPTITPKNFKLVMDTWAILQHRLETSRYADTEEAIKMLAEALDLSFHRVDAMMLGDTSNKLSLPNKLEIMEALERWIQVQRPVPETLLQSTNGEDSETKPASSSRKRQLSRLSISSGNSQPPQPPTNRRKRYKQELAQCLSSLVDPQTIPTSSNHSGASSIADLSTSKRRRTTIGTSMPPSGAKRRPSDLSISSTKRRPSDLSESKTRKRRLSETIHRSQSQDSTDSKARSACPAYEPACVKKRRKSQSGFVSQPQQSLKGMASKEGSEAARPKKVCPIAVARKDLNQSIEAVKQAAGKRFNPHMTVEQLEIGLKVWDQVSASTDEKSKEVEKYLPRLADELEVSHRMLVRFLKGDLKTPFALSKIMILKISGRLQEWLQKGSQFSSQD